MARRVLGDDNELTLMMRQNYARALQLDPDATLNDFRQAVAILEEAERIARRVLGASYPWQYRLSSPCDAREPRSAPASS